jgi:alkylhydroperoxidase family enzyme
MTAPPSRLPRVAAEAVADPELKQVLARAERLSTPKPAWYLTLAHNPEIAVAYAAFWDTAHRGGRVEHTTKELMRIEISELLNCAFCAGQRSVLALEQGLEEKGERHGPRERAALHYARALVMEDDPARFDDVYAELRSVFDDAEIVELGCFAAIAIGGVILSRSLQIDP